MSAENILENLNPECSHYKRCLENVGRQPSLKIALCENCKLNPKLRHVSGRRATACEQCGLCHFVPRVTSSCFFSKRLANRKQSGDNQSRDLSCENGLALKFPPAGGVSAPNL